MRYLIAFQVPEIGLDDPGYVNDEEYLSVNSAGYYEFDETHGIRERPQGRNDFYLAYNLAGTMVCRIRDEEVVIGPGEVFIYKPLDEHYYGPNSPSPVANYWMHFTGYQAASILMNAGLWDRFSFPIGHDPVLVHLFESMISELMDKKPQYEAISASIAQQAVFHISRILSQKEYKGVFTKSRDEITESLKYIHENFAKPLTLEELARESKYSLSRFSHLFKEQIGMSPQQYLVQHRLQKAKELLLYSGLSIKQIAGFVGIQDQLYFSRFFKKYEKMTPMEFRNRSASGAGS